MIHYSYITCANASICDRILHRDSIDSFTSVHVFMCDRLIVRAVINGYINC